MEYKGWVKIYRKILNNPILCKDACILGFWVWLLMNVEYEKKDVYFKGKRITLLPGQILFKVSKTALELGLNRSKLVRITEILKNEHQIEQQSDNRNTLVTLLNWEKYQSRGQQSKHPPNTHRTSTEHQANNLLIYKESKEYKEVEEVKKQNCDDDLKKLVAFYENNIHPVANEVEKTSLVDMLSEFGFEVCKKAITRAVKRGKFSIGYVSGILSNWKQNGMDEEKLIPKQPEHTEYDDIPF